MLGTLLALPPPSRASPAHRTKPTKENDISISRYMVLKVSEIILRTREIPVSVDAESVYQRPPSSPGAPGMVPRIALVSD